jgi:hypothetical protein
VDQAWNLIVCCTTGSWHCYTCCWHANVCSSIFQWFQCQTSVLWCQLWCLWGILDIPNDVSTQSLHVFLRVQWHSTVSWAFFWEVVQIVGTSVYHCVCVHRRLWLLETTMTHMSHLSSVEQHITSSIMNSVKLTGLDLLVVRLTTSDWVVSQELLFFGGVSRKISWGMK